jgi:hypothetical protein
VGVKLWYYVFTMSEKLDIGKAEKNDEKLEALKEKARERIMKAVEKFSNEPNLVINIEDETPETIVLGLRIVDPEKKEFRTYRKGFMKILRLPDGSSIEEAVEKELRFPGKNMEGD